MSLQVCLFLCVLVICITILIVQIIEHYPAWCTYYEYKEKAKQFDDIQKKYCDEIKELSKTIDNLKRFGEKEHRAAFEYRNDIGTIKNIINNNRDIEAIETIKKITNYLKSIGL